MERISGYRHVLSSDRDDLPRRSQIGERTAGDRASCSACPTIRKDRMDQNSSQCSKVVATYGGQHALSNSRLSI